MCHSTIDILEDIFLTSALFHPFSISQYGFKQRLMDKSELDHVTQVIGYHPSYLEHFLKIQNFILRGDGPLPYAYRHYLAIMVSQSIASIIIYYRTT